MPASPGIVTTRLRVPAMPCVVLGGVFDAWSWCASDHLAWSHHEHLAEGSVAATNPADLVFVVTDGEVAERIGLPRELARLHAKGFGFDDTTWALAPYAIDDATDLLHETRTRPRDVLALCAPSLPALVWGLHDWAHFHNHGPFDDPPMTELACDLVALAWLRENRDAIGIDEGVVARVAQDLAEVTRRRFAEAGRAVPCDAEAIFAGPYPAEPVARTSAA